MYEHDSGFLAITEATISIHFHLLFCPLDLSKYMSPQWRGSWKFFWGDIAIYSTMKYEKDN